MLLYRLHEIVKCNVAFIVEGEKDADPLATIDWTHMGPGVVVGCTTAPNGANTWQVGEYGPYFAGKRTYIIPDSDAAGAQYEKDVTCSVSKYAAELHVVNNSARLEGCFRVPRPSHGGGVGEADPDGSARRGKDGEWGGI